MLCAIVKQIDREHKAPRQRLDRKAPVFHRICMCMLPHTRCVIMCDPLHSQLPCLVGRFGRIPDLGFGTSREKEDQWARQPATYGGLQTFLDLRDVRSLFNQLRPVSTQKFCLAICSPKALHYISKERIVMVVQQLDIYKQESF